MTRHPVAIAFGKTLCRYRKELELSQEALGFEADLHRTYIGQLERGERVPKIETVVKLSSALGVKVHALLEGITWTPSEASKGVFAVEPPAERIVRHRALMKRAADLRAGQTEVVDAVALIHEGRDELTQRTLRALSDDGPDEAESEREGS
jgi:transcriptional regulator with XRE-family HTH domain